ncbi:DUF317 domain-containing protein [Streptomyces sp. CMB-StM0423]|uniref:DUF317 domain-containing protein n=1 Tax=Streptomyces sp. CMB-StM0423 TaxID=2059884 RepID=UPI000C706BD6|nr:DUF317 domain-containing protein [Streptomyces sp. CMB-StM0423]AUH44814.1 hypothetical protein CXR04_09995 [Streptomyces sp. CMB-StM0423]
MLLTERLTAAFADTHAWQIPYDTTPRHLAGPGDPRHVTHGLAAAGWRTESDPLDAEDVALRSPDYRYRLQYTPAAHSNSRWWYLQADPTDIDFGWHANLSGLVPAEVIASLTDTLVSPTIADPPGIISTLKSAAWRVIDPAPATAVSADGMCQVELRNQEFHDTPHWHVETREPRSGRYDGPRIWDAWFSDYMPERLVAAFVTALADPAPLHRAMFDSTVHYGAASTPSALTPDQVVAAHATRITSLHRAAHSARRQQKIPAASPANTGTARAAARR